MTTYYVDNANGSDSNDGSTEGLAFATIQKAVDTVAAGDIVYIQSGTDYDETVTAASAAVGTNSTGIFFVAYTTTITDGGVVTIDPTSGVPWTNGSASMYHVFANLHFTNSTGSGFQSNAGDSCTFYNCEFSNNSGSGIFCDNIFTFISCSAHDNATHGFDCDSTPVFMGCESYNNDDLYVASGSGILYNCLGYNPSSSSFSCYADSFPGKAFGCTFDCDNKGDCYEGDGGRVFFVDNILYDATAWAIEFISPNTLDPTGMIAYNLPNSNGTGDYEITNVMTGWNDASGAPAFEDEANDDYTLGSSSPAIDAGCQPGLVA